jgi:hypothetical protein
VWSAFSHAKRSKHGETTPPTERHGSERRSSSASSGSKMATPTANTSGRTAHDSAKAISQRSSPPGQWPPLNSGDRAFRGQRAPAVHAWSARTESATACIASASRSRTATSPRRSVCSSVAVASASAYSECCPSGDAALVIGRLRRVPAAPSHSGHLASRDEVLED